MSRAIFFVAILIVVAYAVFYRNMQHNIPAPGNVEQKRMHQAGDDSSSQDTNTGSGQGSSNQ